ncbi:MAG: hypothetical protein Kow0068_21940 [Marinilabiliales bacterium]
MVLLFNFLFANAQDEDYMKKGEFRLNIGDYQQALAMFTKAIEEDSTNIKAYLFRAKVYMYDEDYEMSMKDIQKAISIDSLNADVYMMLGKLYYLQKKYLNAAKAYEKAGTLNQKLDKVFYNAGLCYYKAELYDKSIQCFDKELINNPDHGSSYKIRGLAKYMNNDRMGGCEDFEKAKSLGTKGLDHILETKCYKMNIDSLGGEQWKLIDNPNVIDKSNAKEINSFNTDDPASIVNFFYASKISGNKKWKKVVPAKKQQTIKLKRTLNNYNDINFLKFNNLKTKVIDDNTMVLSVFYEYKIKNDIKNNIDNVILKKNADNWYIYDLPVIE